MPAGCTVSHDAKREVIIYDYVDMSVPVSGPNGRKTTRRISKQSAIGFSVPTICFFDQSVASGEAARNFSPF